MCWVPYLKMLFLQCELIIIVYIQLIGIVPIFCEEIFQGIDEKKQGGDEAQYEVHFSSIAT